MLFIVCRYFDFDKELMEMQLIVYISLYICVHLHNKVRIASTRPSHTVTVQVQLHDSMNVLFPDNTHRTIVCML